MTSDKPKIPGRFAHTKGKREKIGRLTQEKQTGKVKRMDRTEGRLQEDSTESTSV